MAVGSRAGETVVRRVLRHDWKRVARALWMLSLLAWVGLQAGCLPMPYLRAPGVSGRVVDASGAPIAGAVVVVRYDARYEEILPDRDLVGLVEAETDAAGAFRVESFAKPGLSLWPMVKTEARIVGVMSRGHRCPAPRIVPESGIIELSLETAEGDEDRRGSCRPVTAKVGEAPRHTAAWRELYPSRETSEQADGERQIERLLSARAVFGQGDNCEGPVLDLALAPGGHRVAYLAQKRGTEVVGVVSFGERTRHVARLTVELDDDVTRSLAWTDPGELVLWSPASKLDRALSASVFAAAAPEVVWKADSPPAAPLPSVNPGPVKERRPRRPLDPALLNDEGDVRWLGRSFALSAALDPDTGLGVDHMRITEENGETRELVLPGETCGPRGQFGRPYYRIAADMRSALDLRYVKGGCHAVSIDLETGRWSTVDDVGGAGACREKRRVPASQMSLALRSYALEIESAMDEAGADPSAAYTLRIAEDGGTEAFTRDYTGDSRVVPVPPFPLSTPLRRIDVSVVGGGGGGGSRAVPGLDPL